MLNWLNKSHLTGEFHATIDDAAWSGKYHA